jgi:hypothetical protein
MTLFAFANVFAFPLLDLPGTSGPAAVQESPEKMVSLCECRRRRGARGTDARLCSSSRWSARKQRRIARAERSGERGCLTLPPAHSGVCGCCVISQARQTACSSPRAR